jgi:tetratricopeptide (TPR) repeat protein
LSALTEAAKHLELVRNTIKQPPSGFEPRASVNEANHYRMYRVLQECYRPNGLFQPRLEQQAFDEMIAFGTEVQDQAIKANIEFLQKAREFEDSENDIAYRELLETKLRLNQSDHNLKGEFLTLTEIAKFESDTDQHIAAIRTYRQALRLAQQLEDKHEQGRCLQEIALQNSIIGQWAEADTGFIEAAKHINSNDRFAKTRLHWLQAMNWLALGKIQESVNVLHECLTTWKTLEDHMRGAITRAYLSIGLLELGESGEALELAHDVDRLTRTLPYIRHIQLSLNLIVYLQLGQLTDAQSLLEDTSNFADNKDALTTAHIKEFNIAFHAIQGHWQQALPHAIKAFKTRQESGLERFRNSFQKPRWLEIETLLRGGHENLARESVQQLGKAVESYQRLGIVYLRSLAALKAWEGNLESAIQHLLEARALMIPIGLPNERWTLEAKLADLCEQRGDLETAQHARDTAFQIIQSLANKISDLELRNTFLEFATKQNPTKMSRSMNT